MATFSGLALIVFVACFLSSKSEEGEKGNTTIITELGDNGQTLNTEEIDSSWTVASLTNKVLIIIIVIIVLIAGYLVFRYYRLQKRKQRLTRYKKLQSSEEVGGEEEIVVYEKEDN